MPELPEVETVRRGLEQVAVGSIIESAAVFGARSVRRQTRGDFESALSCSRIEAARRHGKYLYLALDRQRALVIHLRMSGRLRFVAPGTKRDTHTHIVLSLEAGELHFVDPRTFGEMFVTTDLDDAGRPNELRALGVDPLVDPIDAAHFGELLSARRTSLKGFFLDQHGICGIGNLYADEICFAAHLRPDRRTDTLESSDRLALFDGLESVIKKAVEERGSSLSDSMYRDLFGELGSYQDHHFVYGRAGEPCLRCGHPIERARLAGRSAYYCEHCQH